jgi:hypothetical protein
MTARLRFFARHAPINDADTLRVGMTGYLLIEKPNRGVNSYVYV